MPQSAAFSSALGNAIGRRIRNTRLSRRMSQPQVETLSGIGKGALSRIESGERTEFLTVVILYSIAKTIEADIGWLVTGIVPDGRWRPPLGEPVPLTRGRPPKPRPESPQPAARRARPPR